MVKKIMQTAIVVSIIVIAFFIVNNKQVDQYIETLQTETSAVGKISKKNLYKKILSEASKYDIPPQDAKIDRVWKTIPGYNGLKVDIDASYEKMKSDGKFSKRKLQYKQVSPEITLKDLPPAPIFKGHPEKNMVSFLINVAWGNEYISTMLATLKKHQVKATFFLEGRWVKKNPQLAKMIADAGHEIGNHSYTHADFKRISIDQMRQEIIKTNEIIEATTGEKCKWFGPPSGSFRDDTVKIAAELGLGTIMWTVDTIDWQKPSVSVLMERVLSKVHPGALVLMHPTEPTDKSLDKLIVQLKERGLTIDTVSNLLSEERIITNENVK